MFEGLSFSLKDLEAHCTLRQADSLRTTIWIQQGWKFLNAFDGSNFGRFDDNDLLAYSKWMRGRYGKCQG